MKAMCKPFEYVNNTSTLRGLLDKIIENAVVFLQVSTVTADTELGSTFFIKC